MDQIGEYLASDWVTGLVGVSICAAMGAALVTWVLNLIDEFRGEEE